MYTATRVRETHDFTEHHRDPKLEESLYARIEVASSIREFAGRLRGIYDEMISARFDKVVRKPSDYFHPSRGGPVDHDRVLVWEEALGSFGFLVKGPHFGVASNLPALPEEQWARLCRFHARWLLTMVHRHRLILSISVRDGLERLGRTYLAQARPFTVRGVVEFYIRPADGVEEKIRVCQQASGGGGDARNKPHRSIVYLEAIHWGYGGTYLRLNQVQHVSLEVFPCEPRDPAIDAAADTEEWREQVEAWRTGPHTERFVPYAPLWNGYEDRLAGDLGSLAKAEETAASRGEHLQTLHKSKAFLGKEIDRLRGELVSADKENVRKSGEIVRIKALLFKSREVANQADVMTDAEIAELEAIRGEQAAEFRKTIEGLTATIAEQEAKLEVLQEASGRIVHSVGNFAEEYRNFKATAGK